MVRDDLLVTKAKVHAVGEIGGGCLGMVAVRHLGVGAEQHRARGPVSGWRRYSSQEDKMIEDWRGAGHSRMGSVLESRVNLSRMANYNNAIVITVEGNLSATRPKTE